MITTDQVIHYARNREYMSGGIEFVNRKGVDWVNDAIAACKDGLTEKGFAVLN